MQFKNKAEQYEWWTETIGEIQKHEVSIRQGCRELGITFGQYYDWKERVQSFVDGGKVALSEDEAKRLPRGRQSQSLTQSRTTQRLSFVEVVDSVQNESQLMTLHFKDSWRLEIPENFPPSTLSLVIKALEASS